MESKPFFAQVDSQQILGIRVKAHQEDSDVAEGLDPTPLRRMSRIGSCNFREKEKSFNTQAKGNLKEQKGHFTVSSPVV